MIYTDASFYAIGVTLLHREDKENPETWLTLGFWSKNLTGTEKWYSMTKRECLSVVWEIRTPRPYIEGTRFLRLMDAMFVWTTIPNSVLCRSTILMDDS